VHAEGDRPPASRHRRRPFLRNGQDDLQLVLPLHDRAPARVEHEATGARRVEGRHALLELGRDHGATDHEIPVAGDEWVEHEAGRMRRILLTDEAGHDLQRLGRISGAEDGGRHDVGARQPLALLELAPERPEERQRRRIERALA
jgi:hypothetical protein